MLVIGHRRPDGDCIGSQVAMTRILISLGIDAIAVNNDPIPRTLQKFVGDTPFVRASEIKEPEYKIVTVDCADHARVGDDLKNRYPQVFLNVDHHVSNTKFAENNFVFSDASVTGEILAKFFFDLDEIDAVTADALYLGFVPIQAVLLLWYECRSWKYVESYAAGGNPSGVAQELYEEETWRIQFLQKFLASFRMEFDDRVCVGSIHEEFYDETGTQPEDAENFVDYARSLEGVEIGALIENRRGVLKGSLRAKNKKFRVDLLAKEFNGGGHACAAGFNVDCSYDEFYPKLVKAVGHHLEIVNGDGFR